MATSKSAMALVAVALLALALGASAQTPQDCDRSVKHCNTCRYQFFRGTTTKAICTKCDTGYLPKASGRACYCAAGYYTNETTSVPGSQGFACNMCGAGYYCPGSKITAASSSVRLPCGTNKLTTTDYAQSELECMVLPGYGWAAGDASGPCAIGEYNPGYNARKCSPCPGGLTTVNTKSTSSQDCLAGVGFYYLRGKAVACARGTYKNYTANQDCDKCPTGTSTANGTVSADVKEKCNVLLPGYEFKADGNNPGETEATECPPNTYRTDEQTFAAGSAKITCTPCPNNLVTLPNVTRATSLDACVTPPGYGWSNNGQPGGRADMCTTGTFNPGYNRQPCASCGNGLLTDAPGGATSADACYTPSGYGNVKDAATGVYNATICPVGTYGRPNNTYGLVDVECTKCLDHSTTNITGANSQSQCLVEPGYGWADGQVLQCEYGYYNEGYNQNLCTYCGDGYNTSRNANASDGEYGATNAGFCRVDFGYFLGGSGGIEACLRGSYKDVLGPNTCTTCPAGTSTTKAQAGLKISDCDTCKPGYGVTTSDGKIANLSAPSCGRCSSGSYSSGFVAGGQRCDVCPPAFPGARVKMVSRPGIFTPEDCYGEFTTNDDVFDNTQAWDLIAMPASTLSLQDGYTDLTTCQTKCAESTSCQYFAFYKSGAPDDGGNGGVNKCYFRSVLAAGAIVPINVADYGNSWDNPTSSQFAGGLVAFEIREGQYVVYPATDAEDIGEPIGDGAFHGLFAAKALCEADRTCVGLKGTSQGWKLFGATKREDAIGKIRVIGENIQSWVPWPVAA